MYLCPRVYCAFHLSAGRALIYSVPFRLRPLPRRPSFGSLFFVLRHPPWRSSAPLLRSHTQLPRLSSPSRLPVSFAGNGNTAGNTTSRAKIHRDFNTFNSFNNPLCTYTGGPVMPATCSTSIPYSSFFLSNRKLVAVAARDGCGSRRNGCIDGIRVR